MIANREAWREFITSPEHAGRFLSRIGDSVGAAVSEPVHMDELQSFLASLRGGTADVTFLATVVELLSGGHVEFMRDDLPVLLDQLSSETARRDEIVGPAIQGSVRWMPTNVARRTGKLAPGRYFSVTARRSYDIPENRTVRRYLDALDSATTWVARKARPGRPPSGVQRLLDEVRQSQAHDAMRGLQSADRTDEADLQIAETCGRAEYETVANLLRSIDRIGGYDDERRQHAVLMLLAVGWLEPLNDDDLFELYILVLVLDVLGEEAALGSPVEIGLVRSGRSYVARFDLPNGRLKVFFDTSLARIAGCSGRYKRTVSAHSGITGNERRPDVVLAIVGNDGTVRRVLIVEAKRSDDGRYLSDSVYKVFGYLHDFAGAIDELHAVLAVPESVHRTSVASSGEITIVSGDDREALAGILSEFVKYGLVSLHDAV